jgi:hypothetical protein
MYHLATLAERTIREIFAKKENRKTKFLSAKAPQTDIRTLAGSSNPDRPRFSRQNEAASWRAFFLRLNFADSSSTSETYD